MLITGTRRGCLVEDCTKYVPNSSVQRLVKYYAGVGELTEKDRQILELYEHGMNDSQIGRALDCRRQLIADWRAKMGLPSQYGRQDDED